MCEKPTCTHKQTLRNVPTCIVYNELANLLQSLKNTQHPTFELGLEVLEEYYKWIKQQASISDDYLDAVDHLKQHFKKSNSVDIHDRDNNSNESLNIESPAEHTNTPLNPRNYTCKSESPPTQSPSQLSKRNSLINSQSSFNSNTNTNTNTLTYRSQKSIQFNDEVKTHTYDSNSRHDDTHVRRVQRDNETIKNNLVAAAGVLKTIGQDVSESLRSDNKILSSASTEVENSNTGTKDATQKSKRLKRSKQLSFFKIMILLIIGVTIFLSMLWFIVITTPIA